MATSSKVIEQLLKSLPKSKTFYHGTRAGNIKKFDPKYFGKNDPGFWGKGVYLTGQKYLQDIYAGGLPGLKPGKSGFPTSYPTKLNIKKPFIFNRSPYNQSGSDFLSQFSYQKLLKLDGWTREEQKALSKASFRKNPSELGFYIEPSRITEVLQKNGYDSLIVNNKFKEGLKKGGLDEVVVFDPKNIYSAISGERMGATAAGAVGLGTLGITEESEALPLFHASPHKFTKFLMEKIGTGEGAQAFGHGLYFAESLGLGKWYLKQFGEKGKRSFLYHADIPDEQISKMLDYDKPLIEQSEYVKDKLLNSKIFKDEINKDKKAFYKFKDPELEWQSPPGRTNEYSLAVKGRQMGDIHYSPYASIIKQGDKYILETNMFKKTEETLENAKRKAESYTKHILNTRINKETNKTLYSNPYHFLSQKLGSPEKASNYLKSKGIPGNIYFDAMSRTEGKGTRNIVIFDPSIVKINRRQPGNLVKSLTTSGIGLGTLGVTKKAPASELIKGGYYDDLGNYYSPQEKEKPFFDINQLLQETFQKSGTRKTTESLTENTIDALSTILGFQLTGKGLKAGKTLLEKLNLLKAR